MSRKNNPPQYKFKYPNVVSLLRQNGVKVGITHSRLAIPDIPTTWTPQMFEVTRHNRGSFHTILSYGGNTKMSVSFPNGASFVAHAACSKKDQFCRKMGIEIAFSRIIAAVFANPANVEEINLFVSLGFTPSQPDSPVA